jgi:hypothetical protein
MPPTEKRTIKYVQAAARLDQKTAESAHLLLSFSKNYAASVLERQYTKKSKPPRLAAKRA